MKLLASSRFVPNAHFVYIDIQVNITCFESNEMAASKISPVIDLAGNLDKYALNEYENFVVNVLGLLDSSRFEEVDISKSNKSATSWYEWFYVKNKDSTVNSNCIIRLRISDHINHVRLSDSKSLEAQELRKAARRSEARYLQDFANKHKKSPDATHNQRYYSTEIVVNQETFDTYLDAFGYAEELIDRIYHKYSE